MGMKMEQVTTFAGRMLVHKQCFLRVTKERLKVSTGIYRWKKQSLAHKKEICGGLTGHRSDPNYFCPDEIAFGRLLEVFFCNMTYYNKSSTL
jgi:hypothetical protein